MCKFCTTVTDNKNNDINETMLSETNIYMLKVNKINISLSAFFKITSFAPHNVIYITKQ